MAFPFARLDEPGKKSLSTTGCFVSGAEKIAQGAETAVRGAGRSASFSCNFAKIIGPNWDTLPAPRVKIMSPGWAAATTGCDSIGKGTRVRGRRLPSLFAVMIRPARASPVMPSMRRFAGGVNIEDDQRVGILKRGGKFVHEIAGASVAVRLKYDMDFAEATLPGRRQRGANFGGMVAVVIDHADPGGLASQLESSVHTAEVFESAADVVGLECRDRFRLRWPQWRSGRYALPEHASGIRRGRVPRRPHENG